MTASRQKLATSAREMDPAVPVITFVVPVGGPSVSPPGRTTVHSRSLPFPERKRASCSFLSTNASLRTVHMNSLKAKGAWSKLSPAPMLVTTDTRFTSLDFMELMMLVVPSVSIVLPTSDVLPPRATTHPVMGSSAPSKTLDTSDALVTSPCTTRRRSEASLEPAAAPPEPGGTTSLDGDRQSTLTLAPLSRAWYADSEPTPPVAPNTAMCGF
mmetsp:Transcript_8057/g.22211  ORF Transcript_8057/g.22211 Transcript_8057/m.22211 type:complete len:213 (+) Transcript_8057:345-983(+)